MRPSLTAGNCLICHVALSLAKKKWEAKLSSGWLRANLNQKYINASHTKTPVGTSYHSRDQRREIHHFAFKAMLNSDLFSVLPFI